MGIYLAGDSLFISMDNLARQALNVPLHLIDSGIQTNADNNLLHENQYLLVGKTVARSGQSTHASTESLGWTGQLRQMIWYGQTHCLHRGHWEWKAKLVHIECNIQFSLFLYCTKCKSYKQP